MDEFNRIIPGSNDVNFLIALMVPAESILSLCLVNRFYAELCNNENYWRNKLIMDYSEEISLQKQSELSWKNYYIDLAGLRRKPVYVVNEFIGEVWIRKNNTIAEAIKKVITLVLRYYPQVDPNIILIDYINANNTIRTKLLQLSLREISSRVYRTLVTDTFYGIPIWNIEGFQVKLFG
ncbi:hypothetical protein BH23THE1_BH23THE1_36440 [soil metagenome]